VTRDEGFARPGQKVWALTSTVDEAEAYLPGVFSSKEEALRVLAEDWIGEEEAAAIIWTQSPHNPEFFDGVEPSGKQWCLATVKIDEV
jgi:hypothetical protein